MAGSSDKDPRTKATPFDKVPNYTSYCGSTDLSGLRIGVPRNAINPDTQPVQMATFEAALETMREAGAAIIDKANMSGAEEFAKIDNDVKNSLRSAEFKEDIVKYLQSLQANPNGIHSLDDIISFTEREDSGEQYPDKGLGNMVWTQRQTMKVNDDSYQKVLDMESHYAGPAGILGALDKDNLDLLVVPTWLGHANDVGARMGLPVMAVPLGYWPEDTSTATGNGNLVFRAPGVPYVIPASRL